MPRRRPSRDRRAGRPGGPGEAASRDRSESGTDGDWTVRAITGSTSSKPYRCPGCDQLIPPVTAHLVVWPAEDSDAEHRRHWHRACWAARARRNPGRRHW